MKPSALLISILLSGQLVFAQNAPRAQAPAGRPAANAVREWERAQSLFKAQNYKQAAVAFYAISRRSPDPKFKRRAKFYMGVSLYKMNLKQIASFPFVDLVRTGESTEKQKGLDYIVAIADDLGEPSLLNYSLNHIQPEELSDSSRAVFYGRMGESWLSKGDPAQAKSYFQKALQFRSGENGLLYNMATAELIAKNPEVAAGYFQQLIDKFQAKPSTDLQKGLAIMGQARAYYQARKWRDAADLYRMIPKDHPLYRQSLMELSWSLFRGGQFRSALSPLQTLHTPFYQNFYDPESLLLHGVILLFICHFDEVEPITKAYDDNYYPAFAKIQQWLTSNKSEADYYLEMAKTRKALMELRKTGTMKTETILPFFVLRTLMEEPDIRLLLEYMEELARERKVLEKVYGKTSLMAYGKQILDGRRRATQKNIGALVRNRLATKLQEFNEFAAQFDFLKYETINGQRITLKKKISTSNVATAKIDDEVTRDYYVQNGFRFWPFEGEFWRDEIGNYQYVGVNRCE